MKNAIAIAIAAAAFLLVVTSSQTDLLNVKEEEVPLGITRLLDRARKCEPYILFQASFVGTGSMEVDYKAPGSNCKDPTDMVLRLKASFRGDNGEIRLGGVWINDAQVLQTSTPAATPRGSHWQVEQDVTGYVIPLPPNPKLAVMFRKISGSHFPVPAVLNITIFAEYYVYMYPGTSKSRPSSSTMMSRSMMIKSTAAPQDVNFTLASYPPALPLSPPPNYESGGWFVIESEQDVRSANATLPIGIDSQLIVYLSAHGDEELWYTAGDPFRELIITVDDKTVLDAIWPFPVIYGGTISPQLWQPVAGIGALTAQLYAIDLAPVGLTDGKNHKFSFRLKNAKKTWFVGSHILMVGSQYITASSSTRHSLAMPTKFHNDGNITTASRRISHSVLQVVDGHNITTRTNRYLRSQSTALVDSTGQLVSRHTRSSIAITLKNETTGQYLNLKKWSNFPLLFHSHGRIQHAYLYSGKFTTTFSNETAGVRVRYSQVADLHTGTNTSAKYSNDAGSCYSASSFATNFTYIRGDMSTICSPK